ncbi:MAG TPA: Hpt domain-containing protein [Beijerinckiaceae bacterium]|jgi:HPt (histidine-containing phosphotransfer) domain-containing protein|nr:Hpt domain-containing protein [Beijerinckiaceae bacterium]
MSGHVMRDFGARRSLPNAPAASTPKPTIDLVHLSRQSLGDRSLEIELLTLFERQAEQVAERLAAPSGNGERRWRHDLAHTLKGSAQAVGAAKVAAAAQIYEEALYSGSEAAATAAFEPLLVAIAQARSAVLELLVEG